MTTIESIKFKNYRLLKDTTLPLGRFTLIVGPNGSGKTTALRAFEAAIDPQKYAFPTVSTFGQRITETSPVEIFVQFNEDGLGVYSRTQILPQPEAPTLHPDRAANSPARPTVRDILARVKVFCLDAKEICRGVEMKPTIRLEESGFGLPGLLTHLQDRNNERFESLNREFGTWFPEFDRITCDFDERGRRVLFVRTRTGHHRLPAAELSQGTLLALCTLALAHHPNPAPLVCFEEPDRGIHPRLLRDVQDALYRLSHPENFGESRAPVQVVATTHSPYLLDLYRDHPEEVVIAERVEAEARFVPLTSLPNVEEILQDSHLGDIWYTGILGGVPAHR